MLLTLGPQAKKYKLRTPLKILRGNIREIKNRVYIFQSPRKDIIEENLIHIVEDKKHQGSIKAKKHKRR